MSTTPEASPLGDTRNRAVPCRHCRKPTWNHSARCSDCIARETFFITFGVQYDAPGTHPRDERIHADGWVEINAPDEEMARATAIEHFGQEWGSCYTTADFDPKHFPAGCLFTLKARTAADLMAELEATVET